MNQLLEVSEPGFYVIHDGELFEICDVDEDRENAEKLLAVRTHLDDWTSSMTIERNIVTVGACTTYRGVGPDQAREDCRIVREALVTAAKAVPVRVSDNSIEFLTDFSRVDFDKAMVFDLKAVTYPVIERFLRTFNPDSLKIGLHTVLNTLYFLTSREDNDINLTYREAWDGIEIKDRRTTIPICSSEWLVLTDEEADEAWDESLQNYLEECVLPELPEIMERYFDRTAWERDALMDGRGHALSHYDGQEHSIKVNDQYFCLFRTN